MVEPQNTPGLDYLFISHDMAIVERMSHTLAVIRHGQIVEAGSRRGFCRKFGAGARRWLTLRDRSGSEQIELLCQ
jgi:ABC-type glutathione transport system ATPase component